MLRIMYLDEVYQCLDTNKAKRIVRAVGFQPVGGPFGMDRWPAWGFACMDLLALEPPTCRDSTARIDGYYI